MNTKTSIKALKVLGNSIAVSTEDGEALYNVIESALDHQEEVEVDFEGVSLIVSTFLNASIGQLYGKYSSEFIREHFSIKNLSNDDLNILKKVVDRAKEYFADPNRFSQTVKKSMDNG